MALEQFATKILNHKAPFTAFFNFAIPMAIGSRGAKFYFWDCFNKLLVSRYVSLYTYIYSSYENLCPSPDRRGNPFVPAFGTKDWNG